MYAFKIDENNRIYHTATPPEFLPDGILIDSLPENYWDYLYIEGELVYDPLPKADPEPIPEPINTDAVLRALLTGKAV